ncbi:hypothetical protein ZEAMMB73_Zm00001d042832 [Zea mays]|uniref:Uncharacterized protein n=1 Tax=Zea mays TaxID=4577 RepID=A0A1D6N703_MAIZE|nr:hypothetical protein ZEAMMB73_Zm00001d042832 [Zea mays]
MAARKKLFSPLLLLAMLLIASKEAGNMRMVGAEQCDGIRDNMCPDISKSFLICVHSGDCNKCCQEQGYVHGYCSFLSCKCCR